MQCREGVSERKQEGEGRRKRIVDDERARKA